MTSDPRVLTSGTSPTAVAERSDQSSPGPGFTVLFPRPGRDHEREQKNEPDYFRDLNLDQLVASLISGREEYELSPFFYEHLTDLDTVHYRQEVFADLEQSDVLQAVTAFAAQMTEMRANLDQTNKLHWRYQKEDWFVDTLDLYRSAVVSLSAALEEVAIDSRGLSDLRAFLRGYVASNRFEVLGRDIESVRAGLSSIEYLVRIRGPKVIVTKYEGEPDYSLEVLATFERFKQGAAKDYRVGFRNPAEINHIENQVLECVARLFPNEFAALDTFFASHQHDLDSTLLRFDRELQFYLSYLEYLRPLRAVGLSFICPEVTSTSKEVHANEAFDLVLATKLVGDKQVVVANDFFTSGAERIFVVSGPNQGGKTTFARMYGQVHHLGSIGCPVPGTSAQLYLFDQLYTHFEREEDLGNLTGKLEDDLLRVRDLLARASSDSIVVLNEVFASTTLQDAVFLGRKVMDRLLELDVLGVYVTFVEELASLGPQTVSMVSTIVPENPAERTFKVVRRPADGLAYALAIAEKYGLTYERLRKRVGR